MDLAAIFGSNATKVENIDAYQRALLQQRPRRLDHAETLGDFARTGMLAAGRAVDEEQPIWPVLIIVPAPSLVNGLAQANRQRGHNPDPQTRRRPCEF
jgi:hypothetical protein